MEFLVREYRSGDAAELLRLFRDSIRKTCACDYNPEQIAAWASEEIDLANWSARFGGRYAVVADSGGIAIGFAELQPDGHIDRFYVAAGQQRKGVGKTLLEAILARARQWGISRLRVEASLTARPFFTSQGFRTLAEQTVICRGVPMQNYRMERILE